MGVTASTHDFYIATDVNGLTTFFLDKPTCRNGYFAGLAFKPSPGHCMGMTVIAPTEHKSHTATPLHWETNSDGVSRSACEETALNAAVCYFEGEHAVLIKNHAGLRVGYFTRDTREKALSVAEHVLITGLPH
jgi:hypothetical protein